MSDLKYLNKETEFRSDKTAAMGGMLDKHLHALQERKGAFWASLVEYAVTTRMVMNSTLLEGQSKDVITSVNGKFLSATMCDKYKDAADGKLQEMMNDADVVLDAVLKAIKK